MHVPDDYKAIVTRIRREKNLSLEDLAFRARQYVPKEAVSLSLIQKRLAPGSTAPPSPELLYGLAAALGVEPTVFLEYRLALCRRFFDEQRVGLEDAEKRLRALKEMLATRPATDAEDPDGADQLGGILKAFEGFGDDPSVDPDDPPPE